MRKFVKLGLSLGALVLLLQTAKVNADSGRWVSNGSSWSYIEDDGERATGWERIQKKWYYFNYYGIMQTGWQKIGKTWYYFYSSGEMAKGWLQQGSSWYYLKGSGAMATGWAQIGGQWYHFNTSGRMSSSTWVGDYYLSARGAMPRNTRTPDGYSGDASGRWVRGGSSSNSSTATPKTSTITSGEKAKGWLQQGSSWYYLKGSGALTTGWAQIGGQWYHFNNSGRMSSSTWVGDYYLTASGAMARNTRTPDGYWVDANGRWVRGGSSNNSSTATPKTSTITGTYKGQHKRDYITLAISGTTGTWTEVENDGDREIKQISIDPANKLIYIGDDVKIYTIKGNQLIIDDMDRDPEDRIVLSK